MNRTKLFDRVIEAWGETAQLDMLQEECAELIQAISKKKRGFSGTHRMISEEIADVEILTDQIKRMYSLGTCVELIKTQKLERLERRLDENDKSPEPTDKGKVTTGGITK